MKLLKKYGLMALTIALISTTTITAFAQDKNINFDNKCEQSTKSEYTKETENWTINDYTKYVKLLNVLNDVELKRLENAQNEIVKTKKLISNLVVKENLTSEEKNKLNLLYDKISFITSSVSDLYAKIAKVDNYDSYDKEKFDNYDNYDKEKFNNKDCK